jgi:hypothetical protein
MIFLTLMLRSETVHEHYESMSRIVFEIRDSVIRGDFFVDGLVNGKYLISDDKRMRVTWSWHILGTLLQLLFLLQVRISSETV